MNIKGNKKSSLNNSTVESVSHNGVRVITTRPINVDLVLKFLLTKLLNRQTHPLCLCVETIRIKNSQRLTDKSIELIATLCTELKYLSIRYCSSVKSSTTVSKLIDKCENLKYLDLTGCYNLTQLMAFKSLSQPSLNHSPANYIREYFYLQFIDLSYCTNISDSCVQNICKNCLFIKNLYLRKCKLITDMSVLYIAKYCQYLKELSLSQCAKITDTGIKYFANPQLVGLSTTSIGDYQNRSAMMPMAPSRFKIKYLSLAKCTLITDRSLVHLCKAGFFQQIKYLNLRGCTQVTDKFVKYFTGFYGLNRTTTTTRHTNATTSETALNSSGNYYESKLVPYVPLNLKSLDMAKCCISNKSIEYLCRLVAIKSDILKRLSVRCCDRIDDDGIRMLAMYCKNLQHLNVTKCTKVTSNSLREIKKNCKSCLIQHTNFSFC